MVNNKILFAGMIGCGPSQHEVLKLAKASIKENGYTHTIFHNKLIDVSIIKVEVEKIPSAATLMFLFDEIKK